MGLRNIRISTFKFKCNYIHTPYILLFNVIFVSIYWDSHTLYLDQSLNHISPFLSIHIFCLASSLLLILQSSICITDILTRPGGWASTGAWSTYQELYTLREQLLASPHMPSTISRSSARVRGSWAPPTSTLQCQLARFCVGLVQMTTAAAEFKTALFLFFMISRHRFAMFLPSLWLFPPSPS